MRKGWQKLTFVLSMEKKERARRREFTEVPSSVNKIGRGIIIYLKEPVVLKSFRSILLHTNRVIMI